MAITQRVNLSSIATDLIKESPVFGIGIGQFVTKMLNDRPNLENWQYQPAHSLYFLIASEIGFAGLILFAIIILLIIKNIASSNRLPEGNSTILKITLLLFIGFLLIIAFFDHYFWTINQGLVLFWVASGLIFSISRAQPT
jgi:O-antigen ligase